MAASQSQPNGSQICLRVSRRRRPRNSFEAAEPAMIMSTPDPTVQLTHILGLFPELLGVGGVQEAGRLTAAAIPEIAERRGWSVEFLSLNDPPGLHSLQVAGHGLWFRGFGRAKARFVLAGVRRSRSLPRSARCIVLAAHPNLALPAWWIRQRLPRAMMMVMSHGIEVWQPLPRFRRRALTRADVALAPSSDTANKLVEVQGLAPDKIRKLAWPLNPALLEMASARERLRLPEAFPQGRVILTVGRWAASERYKGADELIRALAQLTTEIPNVHLVAVGGGDDLTRLRRMAEDLGVTDRVHFLESLSREEIAACYSRADIFALPSTGEGFGLVFLEAMAFSKAVVGASCGGTTDVVEQGVNGLLVPPRDGEALARALERLLGDASLRERLGQQGARIVRDRFSFNTFQLQLAEIFEDCRIAQATVGGAR